MTFIQINTYHTSSDNYDTFKESIRLDHDSRNSVKPPKYMLHKPRKPRVPSDPSTLFEAWNLTSDDEAYILEVWKAEEDARGGYDPRQVTGLVVFSPNLDKVYLHSKAEPGTEEGQSETATVTAQPRHTYVPWMRGYEVRSYHNVRHHVGSKIRCQADIMSLEIAAFNEDGFAYERKAFRRKYQHFQEFALVKVHKTPEPPGATGDWGHMWAFYRDGPESQNHPRIPGPISARVEPNVWFTAIIDGRNEVWDRWYVVILDEEESDKRKNDRVPFSGGVDGHWDAVDFEEAMHNLDGPQCMKTLLNMAREEARLLQQRAREQESLGDTSAAHDDFRRKLTLPQRRGRPKS